MTTSPLTQDQQDRIKEYVTLVRQQRELEEKIDGLKPHVLADFEMAGIDKAPLPGLGALSVSVRHNWKFSAAIVQKEDELAALKERERQDGTATDQPTRFLTFRAEKQP